MNPGTTANQRFGHITGPGNGPEHDPRNGDCRVRDDETGITYTFSYADIVTEGFRSLRPGERVRFLLDPSRPGRAAYVIRLDMPDVEDYYP